VRFSLTPVYNVVGVVKNFFIYLQTNLERGELGLAKIVIGRSASFAVPRIPLGVSTKARLLRILRCSTATNHVFDLQQLTMILSPNSLFYKGRQGAQSIRR
jgi:hypothetical protein